MKRGIIFICSLFVLAIVVTAGFFIGKIDNVSAKDLRLTIFPIDTGSSLTATDWSCSDCGIGGGSADNFYYFKSSTTGIVSREFIIPDSSVSDLEFRVRTYNWTSSTLPVLKVFISVDGGDFSELKSFTIVTSTLTSTTNSLYQAEIGNGGLISLIDYVGKKVIVKIYSPMTYLAGVSTYRTVGIDNLVISYNLNTINQQPVANSTISTTTAEIGEEIYFNGSGSSDTDGTIIDWIWNLAGDIVHSATTSRSFATTGTKPISFWVLDDDNASSVTQYFNLNIVEHLALATDTDPLATTTPTSTWPIIKAGDLLINEIYPAPPTGESEWLELSNNTSSTLKLDGLYILDGKFTTTTLSAEIAAGGYLVIETIAGNLNNDGDDVTLRNADYIIDHTNYGDFSNKRDQSWARDSGGNFATTIRITKGTVNVIEAKPVVISSGGSSYSSGKATITSATTTATSTAATSTAPDYRGQLIINEILPDPDSASGEEFIELKNLSAADITLNGFYLADNTNVKHLIKATTNIIIAAGGIVAIKRASSTIALNNSGFEAVSLLDPAGQLIDRITYQAKSVKGQAYARNDVGEWLWTDQITPGVENLFTSQTEVLTTTAVVSKIKAATSKASANYGLVDLEKISELPDASKVKVRGVVSVEPGILGVQVFYLAGSGIQVYCYKKDFPDLKVGDYIEVNGELSTAATGRRLKMSTKADVKFIEKRDAPLPHQLTIADVNDDYENSLVTINGEIIQIKGRSIFIASDDGELEVYVKSQINFQDLNLAEGDLLAVTGIILKNKENYRLTPRTLADFKATKGQVQGAFATSTNSVNLNNPTYYLLVIIFFLIAIIIIFWLKLKK